MNPSSNLLVSLSKWASGQQENFLSDAFVHLLNLLAQQVPDAFALVLEQITIGAIRPTPETASDFIVTSQISTSEGMPDIEISGPNSYALIEVKDESPINVEQIERYSRLVEHANADSKCLVLLTRHHPHLPEGFHALKTIRWTQVTEWLSESLGSCSFDLTSLYVLEQFLGLLEAKGMSVKKAGWEMVSGIQQFTNFKVLLNQALESAGAHRIYTAYGANFNGWAIPDTELNKSIFYIFIRFEQPEILRFLCKAVYVRDEHTHEWEVDSNDHESLERSLDLNAEEVHFFSRGLDSQKSLLEEFLSSCLAQTTYQSPPSTSQQPHNP